MELSQDQGHRVAEDLKGRGKVKVRFTVWSGVSQGRIEVRLDSGQGSSKSSI